MNIVFSILVLAVLFVIPSVAHADDFGTRFYGETHSAFADPYEGEDASGAGLQDIEPAAGQEEPVQEPQDELENIPEEILDKTEE